MPCATSHLLLIRPGPYALAAAARRSPAVAPWTAVTNIHELECIRPESLGRIRRNHAGEDPYTSRAAAWDEPACGQPRSGTSASHAQGRPLRAHARGHAADPARGAHGRTRPCRAAGTAGDVGVGRVRSHRRHREASPLLRTTTAPARSSRDWSGGWRSWRLPLSSMCDRSACCMCSTSSTAAGSNWR